MNSRTRLTLWTGITAVTVVGTMLAFTGSQSVLRTHAGIEALALSMRDDPVQLASVADAHRADWNLQLAGAVVAPLETGELAAQSSDGRIDRISSVMRRFPKQPSIVAAWLRASTAARPWLFEPRTITAKGRDASARVAAPGGSTGTPLLGRFESVASVGEKLDPDNAFFPLMRACALFAGKRDAAAEQAVLQAGQCNHWNDYAMDEPEAKVRLQHVAYGDRAQTLRLLAFSETMLPQFRLAHALANTSVRRAGELESRGQTKEGIALRHALMRCGGLIRSEQQTVIGALVGMEVADTAATNPGGTAPASGTKSASDAKRMRAERLSTYTRYLHAHGMNAEAAWTEAEAGRATGAKAILKGDAGYWDAPVQEAKQSGILWLVGLALLSSGLIVAILWATTLLGARIADRGGRRAAVAFGICAALCVGIWQIHVARAALDGCVVLGLSSSEEWMNPSPWAVAPGAVGIAVTAVFLPALLLSLPLIHSGRRRSEGGRFKSGFAIPAGAVILFALYGGTVALACSSESRLRHSLDQVLKREPQFAAERRGMRWPAPPPPEAANRSARLASLGAPNHEGDTQ